MINFDELWDASPIWANYLAASKGSGGGQWYWYEFKPEWYSSYGEWSVDKGRLMEADIDTGDVDYSMAEASLKERRK